MVITELSEYCCAKYFAYICIGHLEVENDEVLEM